MRQRTRLDHEERIEDALRYIVDHLDDPITLGDLADRVYLSRFHFHRVFQTLVGETVGDLIRRLRLERAAVRLRATRAPIAELAFEAGYATHEAFIRAFRSAFGCAPSAMRRRPEYDGRLPTPNGVHFGEPFQIRFIIPKGESAMQVEIREFQPRKAACMSHRGPYFMIGNAFRRLGDWLQETRTPAGLMVGLYYDDPDSTPADELRSDAGVFVADDFVTDDPRVYVVEVPGGSFAVGTHAGPYDGLPSAWGEMGRWLATSGHSWGDAPGVEIYVVDCTEAPPEEWRTEICVPIKQATAAAAA